MEAYLSSHHGLGDNLFMVGALLFLLNFYEKIYFLCKKKYYSNVSLFFIDQPNIICVPIDENDEMNEIIKTIDGAYHNTASDILLCGECIKSALRSHRRITNKEFLNHNCIDNGYTIDHDSVTTHNYSFIENFYKDIGLNLTYYFEYFRLPSTDESFELYNSVKQYKIIFIQLKCADGTCINISNLKEKYLFDENTILICNDMNLYDVDDKTSCSMQTKY